MREKLWPRAASQFHGGAYGWLTVGRETAWKVHEIYVRDSATSERGLAAEGGAFYHAPCTCVNKITLVNDVTLTCV